MTHNAFFDAVKSGVSGVWFLYGEEEYVKAQAVLTLRGAVLNGEFDEFNQTPLEGNTSAQSIREACETLPLMAEKRLVMVLDWAQLSSGRAKDDPDLDALKVIIESAIDTCVLVFVLHGMPDGRRGMVQFLQKYAQCVDCARLNDVELNKWIIREFKREGVKASQQIAELLSFYAGRDLTLLEQEVAKIAAVAQGEVRVNDVENLATKTLESSVFVMIDHLLSGQKAQAFAETHAMILRGETPLMILAMLSRQARLMYFAKAMQARGMSLVEIRTQLEIAPFIANKLLPLVKNYPLETLENWWHKLTDYDYAVKSGKMSDSAALDLGLILMGGMV